MLAHVDFVENSISPEFGLRLCLDSPLYGFQEVGEFVVSGWIFSEKVDGDVPSVVVKIETTSEGFTVHPRRVDRPDVIKALAPEAGNSDKGSMIGFSSEIHLNESSRVSLFVFFEGREIPWCVITVERSIDVELLIEVVRGHTSSVRRKIHPNNILRSVKVFERKPEYRFKKSIVYKHLKLLIDSVESFSFLRALYNVRDCVVRCQLTGLEFRVLRSVMIAPHNFLFCSGGGYVFIIHQHVSSVDGIYYPCDGVYLTFGHGSQDSLHALLDWIADSKLNLHEFSASHTAFLVGHGRPYHFMYDGLLGLQLINTSTPLTDNRADFYALREDSFIDPLKIFGCEKETNIVTQLDVQGMENEGVAFLKLGALFNSGAKDQKIVDIIADFDRLMVGYVKNVYASDGVLSYSLRQHFPVLWLGVTAQKRSWLQQVEGYAEIIKNLYAAFPAMLVVFDGWTSPIYSSQLDYAESSADRAVVGEIKKMIPKDVDTIDLIGSTIEEKVYVGGFVDMAVVNYSTGSMNVSRICGRPCVTHMNRSFKPARFQHIHKNALHVPDEYVEDLVAEGVGIDKVSYSIDWARIYDAIVLHFGSQNVIKNRRRLDS